MMRPGRIQRHPKQFATVSSASGDQKEMVTRAETQHGPSGVSNNAVRINGPILVYDTKSGFDSKEESEPDIIYGHFGDEIENPPGFVTMYASVPPPSPTPSSTIQVETPPLSIPDWRRKLLEKKEHEETQRAKEVSLAESPPTAVKSTLSRFGSWFVGGW